MSQKTSQEQWCGLTQLLVVWVDIIEQNHELSDDQDQLLSSFCGCRTM